jgi:aryl-alcohol dehydrogenase-like predicted oxidoreductase
MQYAKLGSSGIEVSEVCLGTWAMGGRDWGEVEDRQSIEAIRTAVELGMTFIDTADVYGHGHSEEVVGQALQGRREKVVLATKVGNRWDSEGNVTTDCSYDYILTAVEASLERLQTDYIDVYLIHKPDPNVAIKETMRALRRLLDDKTVRAVGVSRYDRSQIEEATRHIELHAAQYPLNIFRRKETTPILEYCRQQGIGMMAYAPLSKGILTGKYTGNEVFPEKDNRSSNPLFQGEEFRKRIEAAQQIAEIAKRHGKSPAQLAINWNLCQAGVTTSLAGAKTVEQVTDNAGGAGWRLTQDDLDEIERIVAPIEDIE